MMNKINRCFNYTIFGLILFTILIIPRLAISSTTDTSTETVVAVPDVVIGNVDAPITVIEYSSLNCSACAHFHQKVFPIIKEKYIDTGKICFKFRHFPLDQQAAEVAAIISTAPECKQFTLIQRIFEQQTAFTRAQDVIKFVAQLADIPLNQCHKIIKNPTLVNAVLQKRLDAEKAIDIPATPTFLINGHIINYAITLEEFEKRLNGEPVTQNSPNKI